MGKYLLRIYDEKIKTNYIERLVMAEDKLALIDKAVQDEDIKREKNLKLSSTLSIDKLIEQGSYSIKQV